MAFEFSDILKGITSELKTIARTESVIGEPIQIDGKTIIPVIKLKVGFGAGGGEDKGEMKKHGAHGTGGGGGGGLSVEPVAFITIVGDEISATMLSPKGAKLEKLAEMVPDIVGKIADVAAKKHGQMEEQVEEEKPSE